MSHSDNDRISVVPGEDIPRIVDDGTWVVDRGSDSPRIVEVDASPEDELLHEGPRP